jgi:hypothetical protein
MDAETEEFLRFIVHDYGWIYAVIAAIVSVATELFKIPYKKLTDHITSESGRKLANKLIIVFSIGLSILLDWLAGKYLPASFRHVFTWEGGVTSGILSSFLYSVVEGVIPSKKAKEEAKEKIAKADEAIAKAEAVAEAPKAEAKPVSDENETRVKDRLRAQSAIDDIINK